MAVLRKVLWKFWAIIPSKIVSNKTVSKKSWEICLKYYSTNYCNLFFTTVISIKRRIYSIIQDFLYNICAYFKKNILKIINILCSWMINKIYLKLKLQREVYLFLTSISINLLSEIQTEYKIMFNVFVYIQNVLLENNTFFL